jgi:hypothetical protein
VLLTDAKNIYVGSTPAKAVYAGDTQVWPADSGGFDPSSLAGLAVWFDAADYTSGSWPNKAAGGASSVLKGTPAPEVSPVQLNGKPVVRFHINEGRIRIPSGSGVGLDWTLVYVGRIWGTYPGRVITAQYPPSNLLVGFWNGFQDVCYDNGFTEPNTQTSATTDWKLYSGDGAPGLTRLLSNGVVLGTTATSVGWGGTLHVSGYDAEGLQESCDCEVAEVLQYSRKLSDDERHQVEDYLRGKWGLP